MGFEREASGTVSRYARVEANEPWLKLAVMADDRAPVKPGLYETDFVAWAETTAQLLQENQFAEIDLDNLIEEVEALSRSDKREIRSRLIKLLSHLLKRAYQPENAAIAG